MGSDVLSSEEIDSLLRALSEGEIDTDDSEGPVDPRDILSQREIDLVRDTVEKVIEKLSAKGMVAQYTSDPHLADFIAGYEYAKQKFCKGMV